MSFWSFFREQEPVDEPIQFDTREPDPVVERFEETKQALVDLIPAAPLCPPALRRWKETEADLSADPEFTTAVADALRDSQT